jgi:uncharacterized protein YdeI (BOF family)
MFRNIRILIVSVAALLANSAMAAEGTPISELPGDGNFIVSGTVEEVKSGQEFVLRDNSGSISVKLPENKPAVLKQGDMVTVAGNVESGLFGLLNKRINATEVQVDKSTSAALSEPEAPQGMENAEAAEIGNLPEQGMVKLSGTVDRVDNQRKFVLRDPTGTVGITVRSNDNVILSKGAEVDVVGYVNNGFFGKRVNATQVMVTSDALAAQNTGQNMGRDRDRDMDRNMDRDMGRNTGSSANPSRQ